MADGFTRKKTDLEQWLLTGVRKVFRSIHLFKDRGTLKGQSLEGG